MISKLLSGLSDSVVKFPSGFFPIMNKYYRDYFWKDGMPYGKGASTNDSGECFKIISDPYRKRISIEKYFHDQFSAIIYDSFLLDFRQLKTLDQTRWEKTNVHDTVCHIRNQDDRLMFVETYLFENNLCKECKVHSPHGILLSVHKMLYTDLNDSFNGVILFDANQHPVMKKRYAIDEISREYSELLEENWAPSQTDVRQVGSYESTTASTY